jgi:hypothetical protein
MGFGASCSRQQASSANGEKEKEADTVTFADVGWCWDGQGFCLGIPPSIFGHGEGTRWFGLNKTCFMFHPNSELGMEKVSGFNEVICEISKWKFRRCERDEHDCGSVNYLDGRIEVKREEAARVSKLARSFPNITGAIDDDLLGIIKREGIVPDQYRTVYEALKSDNPNLKLWTIVYSRELDARNWKGFEPFIDVVNLCIGKECEEFGRLDEFLNICGEIFPDKPVNLLYRLTDFRPPGPIPMELVRSQWPKILNAWKEKRIEGFSILGGFLIDLYPEQARWIQDFIAAN